MRSVEKRGRSVEEAVGMALAELGVDREEARVEVLEEPSKGLFGLIGAKEARVLVTWAPGKQEVAERLVREIAGAMGLVVQVVARVEEDYIHLDVQGPDLAVLIGRHGQTLEALQYLVNLAVSRVSDERRRVLLDVEGYRRRREETLQRLAARLAEQVRRSGQSVALEPMSAHERRVIHVTLQDHPGVTTRSEGEEPYRKIVISAKK